MTQLDVGAVIGGKGTDMNDSRLAPGQRVLAEGKPATVLPADHPFAEWCRDTYGGMVCVELDEQDTPPAKWRPLGGAVPFNGGHPHKFRVYAPSLVTAAGDDEVQPLHQWRPADPA